MSATSRHPSGPCRLLTALLLAHLVAILALAACPAWHHWLHPDGDDDQHECAVTLFTGGGCDAPAAPASAPVAPTGHVATPPAPVRDLAWVAPVFASARVFEHGPPRHG